MKGKGFTIMDFLLGLFLLAVVVGSVTGAFIKTVSASRASQQDRFLGEVLKATAIWVWQNPSQIPPSGSVTLSDAQMEQVLAGARLSPPPGTTLVARVEMDSPPQMSACLMRGNSTLRCVYLREVQVVQN